MAFAIREKSRNRAKPVNLFLFTYGDGPNSWYAYTDAEQAIVFGGKTYLPIPIDRGAYTSSGTLDKAAIEIRMPQDLPLPDLFRVYPPSQVVSVIIRQGQVDDPDNEFLVCWTGRILGCSREDNQAKFTCEPISTSLRRTGLRRNYQYGCPHVLYGSQCKANRSAATTTLVPLSVAGITVTLPAGWAGAALAEKYLGGMVQWVSTNGDTKYRTILDISGTTIFTLSGPIDDLAEAAPLNMILGCNHQMTDCQDLHNNIQNYGGQPWIPFKSPIGMRSQYY